MREPPRNGSGPQVRGIFQSIDIRHSVMGHTIGNGPIEPVTEKFTLPARWMLELRDRNRQLIARLSALPDSSNGGSILSTQMMSNNWGYRTDDGGATYLLSDWTLHSAQVGSVWFYKDSVTKYDTFDCPAWGTPNRTCFTLRYRGY